MGRNAEHNADARKQTRARLIQTALTLFARDGFTRTSIAAIARAAGLSKGLMYHYFSSKEELIRAVMQQRMHDMQEQTKHIPRDLAPAAQLRAIADALAAGVQADPEQFLLTLRIRIHLETVDLPGLDQRTERDQMIVLFARLGAADPVAEQRFFQTSLLGIFTQYVVSPQPAPMAPLIDRLLQAVGVSSGDG
ncbi:MAG: helix-turn-helix domain-containing protein [Myxococcota bacterium]